MIAQNYNNNKMGWKEYISVGTPVLLLIISCYTTDMSKKMDKLSDQIFHHLTNDEIHTPKSFVVTRAEFEIYQQFRAKQVEDYDKQLINISTALTEIRSMMVESMERNEKQRRLR